MATREQDKVQPSWLRRIGWLVALWAAGVAGLALIAWLIRALMTWAGFST